MKQQLREEEQTKTQVNLRPYYIACFTHSFIIIYGVLILILQFYNPFKQ